MDSEEALEFLNEEIGIECLSDMYAHTLVKFYVIDVNEEVFTDYEIEEVD